MTADAVSLTMTSAQRAETLRRRRTTAGVVLADIARKTGYDVLYVLRLEGGETDVPAAAYSTISAAISDLQREKQDS